MKSFDEISGSDELCDHCPLDESHRGVHCYGGEPVMCEGSHCDEAYEAYVEQNEDKKMIDKQKPITQDMIQPKTKLRLKCASGLICMVVQTDYDHLKNSFTFKVKVVEGSVTVVPISLIEPCLYTLSDIAEIISSESQNNPDKANIKIHKQSKRKYIRILH